MRATAREHGFALLIVLWSLVLLTLLSTQMTSAGRSESRTGFDLRLAAASEAAADGALYQALFHLLDSGDGHWNADGTLHRLRIAGGIAEVSITDAAALVNPNFASPALLQALLHAVGTDAASAADLAEAIADWRTPDEQGRIGPERYRAAGLAYLPPDAPFQSVGELRLVLGMTPALFARLAPHLSVFAQDLPDPQAADPLVRQALREVAGPPAQPDAARAVRDVVMTASWAGGGGDFIRHAAIRLGQASDGASFEILAWDNAPTRAAR